MAALPPAAPRPFLSADLRDGLRRRPGARTARASPPGHRCGPGPDDLEWDLVLHVHLVQLTATLSVCLPTLTPASHIVLLDAVAAEHTLFNYSLVSIW